MRLWAALALMLWAAPAAAADCYDLEYQENSYTVCQVNLTSEDLRLFLYDGEGAPWGQFRKLDQALQAQGQQLGFAMNAGMYHQDRSPVGHYRQNGAEVMRVIPNAGPGNFGMLPNGVLCLNSGEASVIETLAYNAAQPACRDASQSGPMLVIDGKLHPRFLKDSTSRYIRNGVGVSEDGRTAYFAISNNTVTFYEFASLFRDRLKTPNALYFDGNISRLYAPDLNRHDGGFPMGPIVGTVTPMTN
ncbi:MAG: phosphodiester glycosidase family protein [Pseudomonadota bacterium]|nr:phosphodiester glycosidase family protein [Pseudomonadota bacterium]MEE3072403.1 phosphodiester glycosidase family protein [Pseudomonadota bacterium]